MEVEEFLKLELKDHILIKSRELSNLCKYGLIQRLN